MEKYISSNIKNESIKYDTSTRHENGIRYDTVVIKHIPTGIEVSIEDTKGQISAYNNALRKLEAMCLLVARNKTQEAIPESDVMRELNAVNRLDTAIVE